MRARFSFSKLGRWAALMFLVAAIVETIQMTRHNDSPREETVGSVIPLKSKANPFQDTTPNTSTITAAISPSQTAVPNPSPGSSVVPTAVPLWKRPWDPEFLPGLNQISEGDAIRFELIAGEFASGTLRHTEFRDGELMHLAGDLTEPEVGRFFFQKQTEPGKAGDFVGVVELPASERAYRIEPTEINGVSELVEMPLSDAVCLTMPPYQGPIKDEIPLNPSAYPDDPTPSYQDGIISLQSFPGATAALYIDFRGGYTPTWGGITYQKPAVSNAQIKDVWKRVAEDFMTFKINVTTDIQVYQSAPETSRQRVICTPTTAAAPGAGGVAYLNSWNWSGDTPCWSFYSSGKPAAEVISHEAGHTLSLRHDGRITPSEGYYGGQGSGEVGWAPIMGVGYYKPVAQWSKGEYANANNSENDLALIVGNNNSVAYRDDDAGITLATAKYLKMSPDGSISAEGIIETTGDTDAFRFSTTGGTVSLRADPAPGEWADLAIQATLHDSTGNQIAIANPQNQLWASITTTVANGTYTFRVKGAGRNNQLTDGFSSYASLGYYSISGSAANIGAAWTVSTQGDLNGDGKPDLLWRNLVTGRVITWLMNGVNTISTPVIWPAANPGDSDWVPIAAGDFNADGKPDIVWRNSTSGRVVVWFMNGVALSSTAVLWSITTPGDSVWVPMTAGDFNADGKPDLVWRNSISGRVIIWFMNGISRIGTTAIWAATNPGDSAWMPVAAGDFNADGKPDLVWLNSTSGRVIVWFMNGVTVTSTAVLWPANNPGDSDWVPQAAGDFNGDGNPDLIWRNLNSGRVIVWFMKGVTRTGTSVIWAP